MELHDLRSFVAVYQAGSITRAAACAHITRQAMSKSLDHLEAELGSLFERRHEGVSPTGLGRALYPQVQDVLGRCDDIRATARLHASGKAGSLALILEAGAALTLPRGALDDWARERPSITLDVRLAPSEQAFERFSAGEADAVIAGPREIAGVAYAHIATGGLCIVFATSACNDMAGIVGSSPDGSLIADASFLAGRRIFGVSPENHVERMLISYLHERGIEADFSYAYPDTALATSEMESGAGGVIVEAQAARSKFGGTSYVHVPLSGHDAPTWEVGVTYRSDAATIALDLAAYLHDRMDA